MFVMKLLQAHREALKAQRRNRAALEALQRRKFRALVAYCARHSAYYREIIAERRIDPAHCEVEDFPVLDKAAVVANFDRLVTLPGMTQQRLASFLGGADAPDALMDGRHTVIKSSGTTGQIGFFILSEADLARGMAPALQINPYRGRRRKMAFYGLTTGHRAGVCMAATARRGLMRMTYDVLTADVLQPVPETLAQIDRYQPDVLMAYPSGLLTLAEAQGRGEIDIRPQFIQCSGEILQPQNRQIIEQAFGRPVANVYSSAEHLIMGMSPNEATDMLLYEHNFIFEIAEDHVLVTNLYNRTLPFIRYRHNDRLILAEKAADDPLPYRRVREIIGRSDGGDVTFRSPAGKEAQISSFALNYFYPKHAARWQFRVSRQTCCLDLLLEPGASAAASQIAVEDSLTRLKAMFQERDLPDIDISARVVDDIAPDPVTGKVRSLVREGA